MAFEIAARVDEILRGLAGNPRGFFSLRQVARLLGVSTQPVRDWVRLKHLRHDGPRAQVAKNELVRFIRWLVARAEPFALESLSSRFSGRAGRRPRSYPYRALAEARFQWPTGRSALTPSELAGLIGCHPSLIIKAIHDPGNQLGRRRSASRWEVTRRQWQCTFPGSHTTRASGPRPLPGGSVALTSGTGVSPAPPRG